MPRYFFHIADRLGRTPDEVGVELENASAAYDYAVASIRAIVADDANRGLLNRGGCIDIADEAGDVLRVWYREAFCENGAGDDAPLPPADNDNAASALAEGGSS